MRLLLAQHMPYLPESGEGAPPHLLDGPARATRALWEGLAALGHDCRAVAPGVEYASVEYHGVQVTVVAEASLPRYAFRLAAEFDPHWTVVVAGDDSPLLFATALRACPGRVVYLAHAPQHLPFGPLAYRPSAPMARLLNEVAGIVAVSRATQEYVHRWGGYEAALIHPPVYGRGPYPPGRGTDVAVVDRESRGLPIVLALADERPDLTFRVAPFGSVAVAAELAARPNVVLERVRDVDGLLGRARVLALPSLWEEDFGYLAVDAMLRGVPVLASNVGGLAEAMLGVPYVLPVNPILGFGARIEGGPAPEPVVPHQDPGPWLHALERLDDPDHHAEVAGRARVVSAAFAADTSVAPLAEYLRNLVPRVGQLATAAERRAALARIVTWAQS